MSNHKKVMGRTRICTDRRTDRVIPIYPLWTSFTGGITNVSFKCMICEEKTSIQRNRFFMERNLYFGSRIIKWDIFGLIQISSLMIYLVNRHPVQMHMYLSGPPPLTLVIKLWFMYKIQTVKITHNYSYENFTRHVKTWIKINLILSKRLVIEYLNSFSLGTGFIYLQSPYKKSHGSA